MAKRFSSQTGVTIIEVILVMVIAASLFVLGFRQYQIYHIDSETLQVKYNVDLIFQAMANFYQVNCYGNTNPATGTVTAGKLNPMSGSPPQNYIIDISKDLISGGFLASSRAATLFPLNTIVNPTGPGFNGYVAQFNRTSQARNVCKSAGDPTTCSSKASMGTIMTWNMQVAVLLRDKSNAKAYLYTLQGDCLSNAGKGSGGTMITPCPGSSSGSYVVWQRSPSFTAPDVTSDLWGMTPLLQQFNQMYSIYPITYAIRVGNEGKMPDGSAQYILCGS